VCSGLILGSLFAQTAWGEAIVGQVISLATVTQRRFGDRAETRFRVRVRGTCGNENETKDRAIFIVLVSSVAHPNPPESNAIAANFRNAYSTLLAAFLSSNFVQIDSPETSCAESQTVDFDDTEISILH